MPPAEAKSRATAPATTSMQGIGALHLAELSFARVHSVDEQFCVAGAEGVAGVLVVDFRVAEDVVLAAGRPIEDEPTVFVAHVADVGEWKRRVRADGAGDGL